MLPETIIKKLFNKISNGQKCKLIREIVIKKTF